MSDSFKQTGTAEYSNFIHVSKYSRWLDEKGRRETWDETVQRYVDFWVNRFPELEKEIVELKDYIKNFKTMPSMRCLMTAGKALEKDEVAGYNCSYMPIDHQRAFDESMYILMCGTGLGFSVERQFVNKLPDVAEEFHDSETVIHVRDSKIGWASAYRELISLLYNGQIPKWDLSKLRPAGARLKTFGGRSSGPDPLDKLFKFTIATFRKAAGRKLTSIECHDLMCKIGEVVVSGGVRRSALISLSNPSDDRMRMAKSGQWWVEDRQRQLANNSAAYTEKPDFGVFLKEWKSLYESKSGERGFFSRTAAKNKAAENGRRETGYEFGTNPCSEILLRPNGFCNLSEVVVRPKDTIEDIKDKVEKATILGTLQSTLTDFRYLRKNWKKNAEEERLLGVSLTGIMDHPTLSNPNNQMLPGILEKLREHAIKTNKKWAKKLDIPASAAITCVKPSGTVSQLVNSASGIHPRFSRHYIRRVRIDKKDPVCQFMKDRGFPYEDDIMNEHVIVFAFPVRAPKTSEGLTAPEVGAMYQLALWKIYQDHWCEHKPSCTVYYTDNEFLEVGGWLWKNFDKVSGISFLPRADHSYKQAPYEEISEEKYTALKDKMPKNVDWTELSKYEEEDNTSSKELACSGGVCEIVDLVDEK